LKIGYGAALKPGVSGSAAFFEPVMEPSSGQRKAGAGRKLEKRK
jgi:hypothetical protein